MQIRVVKSDGSVEVYLHTKVMGSIAVALGDSDCYQDGLTEQLAEAVTEYIARRYCCASVGTDVIHAMIEVVLSETGFYEAALVLHEHRLTRQIKRSRMEVIYHLGNDSEEYQDDSIGLTETYTAQPWNKSELIRYLEDKCRLSRPIARVVAGVVEEKVLRLGSRRVISSLVREMVANELWAMKKAEMALAEQESVEYAGCHSMELIRSNR